EVSATAGGAAMRLAARPGLEVGAEPRAHRVMLPPPAPALFLVAAGEWASRGCGWGGRCARCRALRRRQQTPPAPAAGAALFGQSPFLAQPWAIKLCSGKSHKRPAAVTCLFGARPPQLCGG